MKNWELNHPFFEYIDRLNDSKLPWTGHTFFAYDLVSNMQPEIVVELGTFKGTSFYSMSQAVKDKDLQSKLFAVDTWAGDENTGYYGDDIYEIVKTIMRKTYRDIPARLLRMTFDEALDEFKKKSVDILHIDGLHTYDAVKHDYDSWKTKVKDDGVIMFHDISIADYGVWRVWNDAKDENPNALAIEFKHSAGLGVLIKNKELQDKIKNFGELPDFTNYYKNKANSYRKLLEITGDWEDKYHEAREKYKSTLKQADKINARLKEIEKAQQNTSFSKKVLKKVLKR